MRSLDDILKASSVVLSRNGWQIWGESDVGSLEICRGPNVNLNRQERVQSKSFPNFVINDDDDDDDDSTDNYLFNSNT